MWHLVSMSVALTGNELGAGARASCMRSEHSTTELHPSSPCRLFVLVYHHQSCASSVPGVRESLPVGFALEGSRPVSQLVPN